MINLSIADYFGFMFLFAQNSLIVALKIFFALQQKLLRNLNNNFFPYSHFDRLLKNAS